MMSEAGLKAILDRKQFEVRITGGHFAGRLGTIQTRYAAGWCRVALPGVEDHVEVHLSDLAPAYPSPPDLLREYNDPRQREVRERPATLATTWMGVLAWQAARPSDRRIHAGVTGHVVTAWATSIASGYATREVKFLEPLPSDAVPAVIDAAFAEPTPPHLAVACGYDGLTDLFGEVG
jgi:hypothetical protein